MNEFGDRTLEGGTVESRMEGQSNTAFPGVDTCFGILDGFVELLWLL
jgi:hypothetical protein